MRAASGALLHRMFILPSSVCLRRACSHTADKFRKLHAVPKGADTAELAARQSRISRRVVRALTAADWEADYEAAAMALPDSQLPPGTVVGTDRPQDFFAPAMYSRREAHARTHARILCAQSCSHAWQGPAHAAHAWVPVPVGLPKVQVPEADTFAIQSAHHCCHHCAATVLTLMC